MRVLMTTSEWPTAAQPQRGSFIVQQAAYLREAGVEVEVFPLRAEGHPFNYVKAWRALRAAHRFEDFDLMHAQFGQSGLMAWKAGLPLVVTFRGSDVLGVIGKRGRYTARGVVLKRVSRMVARWASAVIIVSEHFAATLPPGLPLHVIPSGLDLDLFRPLPREDARRQLGLPLDKPLVLFGGNPAVARKRYPLAQQAVRTISEPEDIEMVVLTGIPRDQVPVYMNACDLLLMTSKHEGSPNVVKEALACNVPVVSVDVGDVRQRIGTVAGCILCPDDTPEALGAAVTTVLRRKPCINGREAVRDLDERLLTRKAIAVYQSVLGQKP